MPGLRHVAVPLLAAALAGCGDSREPRVYRAPKDVPSPLAKGGEREPEPAEGTPKWVVPAGWKALPDQKMRFATFQVEPDNPGLTVAVYSFGPESGALLPNVNRWEQQIGAPASAEADLGKVVTRIRSNGLEIDAVELRGPAPEGATEGVRMLAAIIPAGGKVWFLKFVGPESRIAAHRGEYEAFLRSITFEGGSAPKAGGGMKTYRTPEGWTLDPEPKPMRVATFRVQDGEVIVSSLPGEQSGSPAANYTRWRGQVGLGPVADEAAVKREPVAVGDAKGTMFDFGGPDEPSPSGKRILVVQAVRNGSVWYFKLIGPAAQVEAQRKSLVDFVGSIEFGE